MSDNLIYIMITIVCWMYVFAKLYEWFGDKTRRTIYRITHTKAQRERDFKEFVDALDKTTNYTCYPGIKIDGKVIE